MHQFVWLLLCLIINYQRNYVKAAGKFYYFLDIFEFKDQPRFLINVSVSIYPSVRCFYKKYKYTNLIESLFVITFPRFENLSIFFYLFILLQGTAQATVAQ